MACRALRTRISGFVFFERISDICSEREALISRLLGMCLSAVVRSALNLLAASSSYAFASAPPLTFSFRSSWPWAKSSSSESLPASTSARIAFCAA